MKARLITQAALTAGIMVGGITMQGNLTRAAGFTQIAGCAVDIGVGNNNSAWVVGCTSAGAGSNQIFRWNGSSFSLASGAATRIAVSPEGTPWVVNAEGKIYKRVNGSFKQIPGCAVDIGVGNNDSAWVVGCTSAGASGNQIFRWNGSSFILSSGAAARIAVSPEGTPWVVNAEGKIYKRVNGSFKQILGCAVDIGVGNNDSAWVVGCTSAGASGNQIFRWNGSSFILSSSAATRIAVSPGGTPWVVNAEGKIFRYFF